MNLKMAASLNCKNIIVKKIISITVPGAFEIPFGIKAFWENAGKKKRPDAFIALGCVIRGNTPHLILSARR